MSTNINEITGRSENLLIKIFKDWDKELSNDKEMMMIQDLFGILTMMEKEKTTVVLILNYNGTQEQKEESIKELVSMYEDKEDVVIITWAYVSTKEFPETEYYNDRSLRDLEESVVFGKKPVPFDEIIERESNLLESIGFIDFNEYVGYENSRAYLYGSALGKEVVEYAAKLQKEFTAFLEKESNKNE